LMGMPLPLLPLQILWINLVTDGLPGLALAVEKAERDTMRRPPYPPQERTFNWAMVRDIAWNWIIEYNEERPHDSLGRIPPTEYRKRVMKEEISTSGLST